MVAVGSDTAAAARGGLGALGGQRVWLLSGVAMLVIGLGVRLALGGGAVGDRSAAVMVGLLAVSAWSAAALLWSPRAACITSAIVLVLLDFGALPPRGRTAYDDRLALYQTDQVISMNVTSTATTSPWLRLLVEPVFVGESAPFGLAGQFGATSLAWSCPFRSGLQQIALPLSGSSLPPAGASLDMQLHLTGTPSAQANYLLVYSSSQQGGFLSALLDEAQLGPDTVRCRPA